ncbi:DUF3795 domain-containing protein [Chloroflexota bacterium]
MTIREIGCCGAYCRTCQRSVTGNNCRGCKLGYDTKERDINKAKCKIKICCFRDRKLETCADCADYATCDIIHGFQDKSGAKYRKYKETMNFIRNNSYEAFLKIADNWRGPYERLR